MGSSATKPTATPPAAPVPRKLPSRPLQPLAVMQHNIANFSPCRNATTRDALKLTKAQILLLGAKGSGKSSCVNAFISAAAGEKQTLADVRPSSDHVTRRLSSFNVNDAVKLWDMWGRTSRYVLDSLYVVAGRLKEFTEFDRVPQLLDDKALESKPTFADETHCVLITLSYSTHDPKMFPEEIQQVRELIDALRPLNVPVLVLMTQCDRAADVRADLRNFYESIAIDDAKIKVATALGIEPSFVVPVTTEYGRIVTDEVQQKTWSICLEALKIALGRCNDFYENVAHGGMRTNIATST